MTLFVKTKKVLQVVKIHNTWILFRRRAELRISWVSTWHGKYWQQFRNMWSVIVESNVSISISTPQSRWWLKFERIECNGSFSRSLLQPTIQIYDEMNNKTCPLLAITCPWALTSWPWAFNPGWYLYLGSSTPKRQGLKWPPQKLLFWAQTC